jgi:hypothetical protein
MEGYPVIDFQPADIVAANAQRRRFVRYPNTDSTARLQHAYGRDVQPGRPPRLSIIIPTADGERYGYLPQLLRQIEEQSFQNFEIFIVMGDTRQGRAINLGAALAQGDVLLTFDDDTQLGTPDLMSRLVEALDADPRIGMAGTANRVPPTASRLVQRMMTELPRRSSPSVTVVTDSDMAEHPCLAMRKHLFYQVGGEHEVIPRGLDPYLRREFRQAGYRVVVIPEVWIHHLPPPSLGKLLRQSFRNGRASVLVSRQFPELAMDTPVGHGAVDIHVRPLRFRAIRHAGRIFSAAISLRWVYLATSVAYGLGGVAGALSTTAPRSRDRSAGRSSWGHTESPHR